MQTIQPGTIVYYAQGFDIKSAIFCAMSEVDAQYAIVYPLQDTSVITDMQGHEHYACHRIRVNELYDTPAAAMEAAMASVRQQLEASLSGLGTDNPYSQNARKAPAQAQQDDLSTLDALMIDPHGPRVRYAFACIYAKGAHRLYKAHLTGTGHYGFRIYQPDNTTSTRDPKWHLTSDVHREHIRSAIWSPVVLEQWQADEHTGIILCQPELGL